MTTASAAHRTIFGQRRVPSPRIVYSSVESWYASPASQTQQNGQTDTGRRCGGIAHRCTLQSASHISLTHARPVHIQLCICSSAGRLNLMRSSSSRLCVFISAASVTTQHHGTIPAGYHWRVPARAPEAPSVPHADLLQHMTTAAATLLASIHVT